MTNEAIDTIRKTEDEAEACIADARAEAAEKVRSAKLRADEILKEAEAAAAKIAASAEKTAADHADGVIAKGSENARNEAKKAVAAAEPKVEAAADEIIREIFEKWQ